PPDGALIFATYSTTLAALGNISAEAVSRPADLPRNEALLAGLGSLKTQLMHVANRTPANGGADEETLASTTGRAVEILHAHDRLVDLSLETKSDTLDQIAKSEVRARRSPTNAVNILDIERL